MITSLALGQSYASPVPVKQTYWIWQADNIYLMWWFICLNYTKQSTSCVHFFAYNGVTWTSYSLKSPVIRHLFNSWYAPSSKNHHDLHYWSFVRGIHRWSVNSSHKGPVTRKKLPCDDVIMSDILYAWRTDKMNRQVCIINGYDISYHIVIMLRRSNRSPNSLRFIITYPFQWSIHWVLMSMSIKYIVQLANVNQLWNINVSVRAVWYHYIGSARSDMHKNDMIMNMHVQINQAFTKSLNVSFSTIQNGCIATKTFILPRLIFLSSQRITEIYHWGLFHKELVNS